MSFKQAVTLTGISVIVRDFMPNLHRSLTDYICAVLGMVELFCLFDLILYVQSAIFQLYRDGSSWVEPVLS